jgi:hypothetical protein
VTRDDRAQLFLVGAVVVAVAILGLVVVLNSVLYTESVAPQSGVARTDAAERYIVVLERDTQRLLDAQSTDGYVRKSHFVANLSRYDGYASNLTAAERPATVDVRLNDTLTEDSGVLSQPAEAKLVSRDGDRSWDLSRNASETKTFEVRLAKVVEEGNSDDAFRVHAESVNDSADTWDLAVNKDKNDVFVETRTDGGSWNEVCTMPDLNTEMPTETLNLTLSGGDSLLIEPCGEVTAFAHGVDEPYDLSFNHTGGGKKSKGTFRIATDGRSVDANFYDEGNGTPAVTPVLFGATLDLHYRSTDVTYVTTVPVSVPQPKRGADDVVFFDPDANLLSAFDVANGTVTRYMTPPVAVVGSKATDFDGDDRVEVPYVTAGGELRLVDGTNETQVLATGAKTDETVLGVGTFRGTTSVFYVNDSDGGVLYRTAPAQPPRPVDVGGSPLSGSAAPGAMDYDGDGTFDLVYVTDTGDLAYVDGDTNATVTLSDGDVGQGPGLGVGTPADFGESDGVQVPFVDSASDVRLHDQASGDDPELVDGGSPDAPRDAPVAAADWDGDDRVEVFYVEASSGQLYVADLNGTVTQVQTATGAGVPVDEEVGVA